MRKQWNVIGFAIVCMGQLTVGVALQIALLLVGRHSWPLYALSGWLMGFGAFGVYLGATVRPGTPVRRWVMLSAMALFALLMLFSFALFMLS